MSRRPLIAGNWKMHLTLSEAAALAKAVGLAAADADCEVMIAPPFTSLAVVAEALRGSKVILGAQNCCWAEKGAFTGEVSTSMQGAWLCHGHPRPFGASATFSRR